MIIPKQRGTNVDTTFVVIAVIIAVVVIVVVFLLRDRLSELSVNGSEAKMEAKMEARTKTSEVQDEKSPGVVFKGNKLRGTGEYRMRRADFSQNDVDGDQKVELGYDEPPSDIQNRENI